MKDAATALPTDQEGIIVGKKVGLRRCLTNGRDPVGRVARRSRAAPAFAHNAVPRPAREPAAAVLHRFPTERVSVRRVANLPEHSHNIPMLEFMNILRGAGGSPAMRRCVFMLLLAIVPLQFAWSAASGYCRHEADTGAAHFGHHDHKASPLPGEKTHDLKLKQIADGDDNCIGCHINVVDQVVDRVPSMMAAVSLRPAESTPQHYRSPTPPGLERPARQLAI